ncbi:MAG: ubiquitin-like protein [Bacteroidota bacterium]
MIKKRHLRVPLLFLCTLFTVEAKEKIFVRLPSNQAFVFNVDLNKITVLEIKKLIQESKIQGENIPPANQQLLYKEQELEDDKTLSFYKVQKNQFLDLLYDKYQVIINVKILVEGSLKSLKLNVDLKKTTVGQVKEMLSKESVGIPVKKQRVIFCGKYLKDGKKLSDYGIKADSTMFVLVSNTAKTPSLTEEESDYEIKVEVSREITLDVKATDTIESIKNQIEDKDGIVAGQQDLWLYGDSAPMQLENGKKLSDYGIKAGDKIKMLEYKKDKLNIIQVLPDKTVTVIYVDINKGMKVSVLKQKIVDEAGIPANEQVFSLASKELEDERMLSDYNVDVGFALSLSKKKIDKGMNIKIQAPKDKEIALKVFQNDTIEKIKQKIASKINFSSGYLELIFNGSKLEDKEPLQKYGINSSSTIKLEMEKIKIEYDEGPLYISFKPTMKISGLKEDVISKLITYEYELTFDGKKLDDGNATFGSLSIEGGSTIKVIKKTKATEEDDGGQDQENKSGDNNTVYFVAFGGILLIAIVGFFLKRKKSQRTSSYEA